MHVPSFSDDMTAREGIEKHQHSLDSRLRSPMYQKRSTSFSHIRNAPGADIEMEMQPMATLSVPGEKPMPSSSRRVKSVSVCVAALPSSAQPRTIEQYEQIAVRNGFPQALSAYELCNVRLPALSTSEVFNEPPGMYVYRERPITYPYMKPKQKRSVVEYVKKRKHTITAFAFGIIAITAVMIIIILQMKGDFS